MLNLLIGVVLGVVLCGLGVLTLPKLLTLAGSLKAKFLSKVVSPTPAVTEITTPPPATTPTVSQA